MACKSPPVSGGSSTTALAHGPIFGSSVLALANRLKIKDSKSKQLLSGAHTVEVALPPSTVTRVAIDPDQALADVDRAGSVWTAND